MGRFLKLESSCRRSRFRRELRKIVYTQRFFDTRHLFYALFEAPLAQHLVFVFFHLVAKRFYLSGCQQSPKCREEDRILPALVGPVHPNKALTGGRQLGAVVRQAELIRRRETENSSRYSATRLVLSQKRLDEINECLVLLEDREDVLLFVPFVVFLNKGPNLFSGAV